MNTLNSNFTSFAVSNEIKKAVEDKVYAFWNHVDPNGGHQSGFSIGNYWRFDEADVHFCIAFQNSFKAMIENQYQNAANVFPINFASGDAMDVVESIYNANGLSGTKMNLDQYEDFLRNEVCCYANQMNGREIASDMLRLSLYQNIIDNDEDDTRGKFSGGLFCVMEHFSIEGTSQSAFNESNRIVRSVLQIVEMCILAFANKQMEDENGDSAVSYYQLPDDKVKIRFAFKKEEGTDVYYIAASSLENK